MRIEQGGPALDFCDVLLKPKRSTIKSRKEIDLTRTFKFKYSSSNVSCVPIISSNMTSVTTPAVSVAMKNHNMLSCVPKNTTGKPAFIEPSLIQSVGLKDKPVGEFNWVCLDVPTAYLEVVVDRVKWLRDNYPWATIIVGNVVTAEMTEALLLAGADIVKIGIGGGSACSTRIKTGVGMPQLSAVIECADAAHGLGGHIISDGGCTTPADIVKAFSGGADFVMLGGMLAGHDENGNRFYGMSSERGAKELSGGLKDYRASEGWEIELPKRGPIENTLQDIMGGLRSACSYVGARRIKDLPKCSTFIQVNRTVNQSLWEFRVE